VSTREADLDVAAASVTLPGPSAEDGAELSPARIARVGEITVRRLLPLRRRRSVGPWCFIDHYGPVSVDGTAGMDVPPHPHIGLQTVTWLISGEVLHRDSLGSEQLIRPGQLNLMTAGGGIAHAEESLRGREADPRNLPSRSTDLHGVQLWTALPDASRQVAPAFEHHAELPVFGSGGLRVTVFLGALGPARSPATVFWPGVGAEIAAGPGAAELGGTGPAGGPEAAGELPLPAGHEHVMFVSAGSAQVAGTVLRTGELLYLPPGRDRVAVSAPAGSRLFLLGGQPLGEDLLMWWNFVARTPEEIAAATARWADGGYGTVPGYRGAPLAAPVLDAARLRRPGSSR
jgi:quercetin 2,3-dioxygenase